MTLVEALKISSAVRRPTAKYMGSSGDGYWNVLQFPTDYFSWEDLLADDWEAAPHLDTKKYVWYSGRADRIFLLSPRTHELCMQATGPLKNLSMYLGEL